MREITGVRATPGGRMNVQFHEHGFVVRPDRLGMRVADNLLGEEAGCVTLLVLLASLGLFGLLRKVGAPHAVIMACLWVFIASVCYGALLILLNWVGDVALNILLFLVVAVSLPALLIPGCRRAVLRKWRGGGPETQRGWVPGTALAGVWHQSDPRTAPVVTVQHTDGSVVAYVPPPDKARELYDGFDALLGRHRPAPAAYQQSAHGTPAYQPWQGNVPPQPGYRSGHPQG